jgi:outer membrane protein assembly factor BamB
MQTHWNTAVYVDGYIYGSSGRHASNAELRCIDAKDGEVKWSEGELTRSSLLYVDGHFVCLSENGVLRLLRATPEKFEMVSDVILRSPALAEEDARPEDRQLLTYPAWSAPILSHGLLYVRGKDRLVCMELIPEPKSR